MTVFQLYNRLSSLPAELQEKVIEYIELLKLKSEKEKKNFNRQPGLAKGLISMKDNFDDPIEDFNDYK